MGERRVIIKMNKKLTDYQIENEAYKLWCGGWSFAKIAEKYNVCEKTIQRAFEERKLEKVDLPFEFLVKCP